MSIPKNLDTFRVTIIIQPLANLPEPEPAAPSPILPSTSTSDNQRIYDMILAMVMTPTKNRPTNTILTMVMTHTKSHSMDTILTTVMTPTKNRPLLLPLHPPRHGQMLLHSCLLYTSPSPRD